MIYFSKEKIESIIDHLVKAKTNQIVITLLKIEELKKNSGNNLNNKVHNLSLDLATKRLRKLKHNYQQLVALKNIKIEEKNINIEA